MILTEILLTIFITSLFCCGLSVITSDGMVLYFLRKPFVNLEERIERYKDRIAGFSITELEIYKLNQNIKSIKAVLYCFKPIILCTTCMSSFWGIVIFAALHGIQVEDIRYVVICCIGSSFVNAFFMSKYN